jgi:hypothetical protein
MPKLSLLIFPPVMILISIIIILLPADQSLAQDEIIPGEIQQHTGNEEIIYNWFSYVPLSIDKKCKSYIYATIIGATFDYDINTSDAYDNANYWKDFAEQNKFIFLSAALPRSDIYVSAFDHECFQDSTDQFFQRPDLKLNLMIDMLISNLRSEGYNVEGKVCIEGFSHAGMFAQKYALLHPERVIAIAAGSPGQHLTLPVSEYNGIDLYWAVGTIDLTSLVGYDLNLVAYKKVPQLIYTGELDNVAENDHVNYIGVGQYWLDTAQVDFLNTVFGDVPAIRLKNMCAYVQGIGCDVTFKEYIGVGHTKTYEMYQDTITFFRENTRNPELADAIRTLQVLCDMEPTGVRDFTGDGIIDFGDIFYTLQFEAGLR